jgi:hypothetical protein
MLQAHKNLLEPVSFLMDSSALQHGSAARPVGDFRLGWE